MRFASDNRAGVSPPILEALNREAAQDGGAYGDDELSAQLDGAFGEVFERPVKVFPLATGTAANALALAASCDPWGAVLCRPDAHVLVDECSAVEHLGGGIRLVPIPSEGPVLTPDELRRQLDAAAADRNDVHRTPLQALTVTNLSETGAAYTSAEVGALAELAKGRGLVVHMDGARFANAVVAAGEAPAALTWRAGVEVLSFGATKNGALGAEAVVFFDGATREAFERRRKRAGHLLSKQRFVAAQLLAALRDGHWLDNARHANDAAARLAVGLRGAPAVDVRPRCEGNEVFVTVAASTAAEWRRGGAVFYDAPAGPGRVVVRLVTSFSTAAADVDDFLTLAGAGAGVKA